MEYLDKRGNSLKEGLYRGRYDRSSVLYLVKRVEKWKFQTPYAVGEFDVPMKLSRNLIPIDDLGKELVFFVKTERNLAASFVEIKIVEEIEERRRRM